jgi:glycerophosphoryl diester phosphodiesterase
MKRKSNLLKEEGAKLASILGVEDEVNRPNSKSALVSRPKMYGHRGSLFEEPENTIPSFQRALDHGVQGFELDVFLLKCGNVAVFHGDGGDKLPGGLEGYCGVEGSITNVTAEEAKELEFRGDAHFCPEEKLSGSSIPLLEEVLQYVKENYPQAEIKIELKGPRTELPVVELVEEMDMVDRCTFSSFYHDRIHNVRKLRPQRDDNGSHVYRTGALFADVPDNFIERAKEVDATEVHLRYDTCSKERVAAIHEAGFDSMSWFRGVPAMKKDIERFQDLHDEDERMYEIVLHSGVKAICVNHPGRLVNLVSDIGQDDEVQKAKND